jgi:hypothetical protein
LVWCTKSSRALTAAHRKICRPLSRLQRLYPPRGDAYRYCNQAVPARRDPAEVDAGVSGQAMLEWLNAIRPTPLFLRLVAAPHANRGGGVELERLNGGVGGGEIVGSLFGSWQKARDAAEAARGTDLEAPGRGLSSSRGEICSAAIRTTRSAAAPAKRSTAMRSSATSRWIGRCPCCSYGAKESGGGIRRDGLV